MDNRIFKAVALTLNSDDVPLPNYGQETIVALAIICCQKLTNGDIDTEQ